MADRARSVGFFQVFIEARGLYDLEYLPIGPHLAAPVLRHTRKHGVAVNVLRVMIYTELEEDVAYGNPSSANKENSFVRKEISQQLHTGQVAIFTLAGIFHLQKLRLSPLPVISQNVSKPSIIYDFLWNSLNEISKAAGHKEVMRFGKALHLILN